MAYERIMVTGSQSGDCPEVEIRELAYGLDSTVKLTHPLFTIKGLSNASYADCAKHDPEVNEDTEKNYTELLNLKPKSLLGNANIVRVEFSFLTFRSCAEGT